MITIETSDLAFVKRCLTPLDKDHKKASKQTMVYYLSVLIEEHFKLRSPNSHYRPNKMSYEQWKAKYHRSLPQLVLSGKLKAAVDNGKVKGNGVITFDLPDYGLYQIQAGRDFLALWPSDKKELSTKIFPDYMERIRRDSISRAR